MSMYTALFAVAIYNHLLENVSSEVRDFTLGTFFWLPELGTILPIVCQGGFYSKLLVFKFWCSNSSKLIFESLGTSSKSIWAGNWHTTYPACAQQWILPNKYPGHIPWNNLFSATNDNYGQSEAISDYAINIWILSRRLLLCSNFGCANTVWMADNQGYKQT